MRLPQKTKPIEVKMINRTSSNNSRGRLFEGGDYFKYCSLKVVP